MKSYYFPFRIKCCQIFFEVLNVPAVCIQSQSVLSLYGSGFTSGITVDIGYDSTDINPTYEGGGINYAHIRTGLAGRQLAKYIEESLQESTIDLGQNPMETMDDIMKEVFVTKETSLPIKKRRIPFILPDGEEIDLSSEAFMAGELFFQPDFVKEMKTEIIPVHEAVCLSAFKCDSDLRPELFNAVVMTGGLSMISGMSERLQIELDNLLRKPVNVICSNESYVVPWLGAATFAGIPEGRKLWVTKRQFEEYGDRIVRNKFI